MKKLLFPLAASVLLFCGCSKDYGAPEARNYAIDGSWTSLNVSGNFQVTVSDEVTEAVITVGELAHDRLNVKVKNGVLYIGFEWFTNYSGTATAVIPTNANLRDLDLSGASSFTGDINTTGDADIDISGASAYRGNITASDVDFDISGASKYDGEVTADEIDADISGASTATMTGVCRSLDLGISGSSHLYASGLEAQEVEGDISGASSADVTCCTKLAVNLSGSSKLTYGTVSDDCHPSVNCHTSGSSTVTPR